MIPILLWVRSFAVGFAVGMVLLKCKVVKMEKWEKALPDVWAHRFGKGQPEPEDKYNRDLRMLKVMAKNEQQQAAELTLKPVEEPKQRLSEDDPGPRPEQKQFIRFVCECGKRVKIASKYAGKAGKCPRCGKRIKVPENN